MSIGEHASNCESIYSVQAHKITGITILKVVSLHQSEMAYSRKDLFWVILAGQPYPILAQNTPFQGDEFSNNLFSDLGKII